MSGTPTQEPRLRSFRGNASEYLGPDRPSTDHGIENVCLLVEMSRGGPLKSSDGTEQVLHLASKIQRSQAAEVRQAYGGRFSGV